MLSDFRLAFRQCFKTPGVTLIAVLSLALGIGACTAVFTVVDRVLLQAPPYPHADEIVVVRSTLLPDYTRFPSSPADYLDFRRETKAFRELAASFQQTFRLTGGAEPLRLIVSRASGNFFDVYGAPPLLGRTFTQAEDVAGGDPVVVLSHRFWTQHFGASPNAVGQTLRLDDRAFTVIGVMPAEFEERSDTQCWVPLALSDTERSEDYRGARFLDLIGRLASGATHTLAEEELRGLAARLDEAHPGTNRGWSVTLIPLGDFGVQEIRPMLWLLLGSVACVLLIVCGNTAILLLMRGVQRSREMAIRAALGATRGALARQQLVESLVLAFLGGTLGVLVSVWGLHLLLAMAPGSLNLPAVSLNGRVLAVAVLLTLMTGAIFGLLPALQAASPRLFERLRNATKGSDDQARGENARRVLVSAELALAVALCAGAGLLARTLIRISQVDLGFDPTNAWCAIVELPATRFDSPTKLEAYASGVERQLAALPQVSAVGVSQSLPMVNNWLSGLAIKGSTLKDTRALYYAVSPGYFDAMGIRLLSGRRLEPQDNRADAAPVVVISDALARQYFPNQNPLGQRIWIQNKGENYAEVVGVVAGVTANGRPDGIIPQIYEPFATMPQATLMFVVRGRSSAVNGLPGMIRSRIQSFDTHQPVTGVDPLSDVVASTSSRQRFAASLLSAFSLCAFVVSVAGLYAVMSYSASRRTTEIGVRMALGATRRDILQLIARQGAAVIVVGLLAGLGLALAFSSTLQSLLFQTDPHDPVTLVLIAAGFFAAALGACLLPAWSATRIDPNTALRSE